MPITDQIANLIINHYSIQNIYNTPALYNEFIITNNSVDILSDVFFITLQKQKNIHLLDVFDYFSQSEYIVLNDQFKVSVPNFKPKPDENSPFAILFNIPLKEIKNSIYIKKFKFCFIECNKVYYETHQIMLESCRHYSQNFPAKLIKTALLHGVPKQILFDLVSFNPPECRSVRQFRRQHFGQIASIFKYKDKWIVRPRGEFQGEKVDSVYMQNLMFEKLLKESQIVEKCIAKNAEILVRRSNRVVDSGTQKKEIRQWVNKGKRLSSGQKRFEKWRVKKQQ